MIQELAQLGGQVLDVKPQPSPLLLVRQILNPASEKEPEAAIAPAAVVAALIICAASIAPSAQAQTAVSTPNPCAPRQFRWQEDCSALAGAERHGLDRLRYHALRDGGDVWVTVGGEARTRIQEMRDNDFGIGDGPGFLSVSGRLLLHADVHKKGGARAFVQLGVARENGRKPGSKSHEWSDADVTQAFVDLPVEIGRVTLIPRVGRQELDLFGNRLFLPRDGASLPRTFEGVRLDAIGDGGTTLTVVSFRPMAMQREAFSDHQDDTDHFSGVFLHLPDATAIGSINLFAIDRERQGAPYRWAQGAERRYSTGARYVGAWRDLRLEAQGTWQFGRVAGQPVQAYGVVFALDRQLGGPLAAELGLDLNIASGDRSSTRTIETFDPMYPNNAGLAAPLIYQSNFIYGGAALSAQSWGATWTAAVQGVARHSTTDAVYADGKPIDAPFGRQRPTSLLTQLNVRRRIGQNIETYGRIAHAKALKGITAVGGRDVIYWRLDLTARF